MNNLDLIRFKQIFILLEVLENSSFLLVSEIRRKYETHATNFEPTVQFLQELGIIRISDGIVALTDDGKSVSSQLADNEKSKHSLKESLSQKMFSKSSSCTSLTNELFSGLQREGDIYTLRSPTPQHLTGLRNLLIELEVIDFNYETQIYAVKKAILEKHPGGKRFIQLSKQALDEILRQNDLLGQEAETAVLKFERTRLSGDSDLANRIRHISPFDVAAGYDIESFKDVETKEPIFIEVKAVSITDYEFKWSRNEMDCAEKLCEKYCLYLLPVMAGRKFDFSHLKIIENPVQNILSNGRDWLCETAALSIKLKNTP